MAGKQICTNWIFRSVNKAFAPVVHEEENEIPDAVPIDGRLRVDTIAVQLHEDKFQASNNGGKAPTPIVRNPDHILEDELVPVLQPMPIVPDHTAPLPVPPVPNPVPNDADPILSTNHE